MANRCRLAIQTNPRLIENLITLILSLPSHSQRIKLTGVSICAIMSLQEIIFFNCGLSSLIQKEMDKIHLLFGNFNMVHVTHELCKRIWLCCWLNTQSLPVPCLSKSDKLELNAQGGRNGS